MLKLAYSFVLLAPLAAFAAEPLVVNGVCPEDSGWPTAQQGAGCDTSSWVGYKWPIS